MPAQAWRTQACEFGSLPSQSRVLADHDGRLFVCANQSGRTSAPTSPQAVHTLPCSPMTRFYSVVRRSDASERIPLLMRKVVGAFHKFEGIDRSAGLRKRICVVIGASGCGCPANDRCRCEQSSHSQRDHCAHLSLPLLFDDCILSPHAGDPTREVA